MKDDYPSDAELEARLKGLDYTDPGLRCPADRLIERLCINSSCKTSLICSEIKCDCCHKIHRKCQTVLLGELTLSLNEKIGGCKDFVSSVFQIENVLMDELQVNRGKLIKEFYSSHLNSQHQKIVREIYEERDWKDITGKMAKELMDELEQEEEQKKKRSDLLLEEYRKELRALTERLVTAQRRIYQQYSENKEEPMEFEREFNSQMPNEAERERLMEEERGRLMEKNRVMEEERNKLEQQNGLMKEDRKKLQEQNGLMKKERKKLQEQNGLVKEDRKKLQAQNGLMKNQRKKLQEQNGLVKKERKKLQEQNGMMKIERKKLQEQNGLVKKERKKLQEQNGMMKIERKKLQEQNGLVKKERKKLQEQNGLMKKERKKLQEQKKGEFINSLILKNDKKGEEYLQFLRASLKQPKKIELLYRGSSNQFRVDRFHQKCDNTPDTFTLLRTEFGKVIGGFSHYAWNAVNKDQFGYVSDGGRNAFLLSFDLKQKMVPNSHQHLIYCHPNYGPTFGGGHDLHLADICNQNNSFADFPKTYNFEQMYKINSQESWKAFSGATDGCMFKVLEYEVFRVRYE